jgi:Lamin Tail Domain
MRGRWLRAAVPVLGLIAGACGQIISADFDDLTLDHDASAGSGGSGGAGATGGSKGGSGGSSGTRGSGGSSGGLGADGAGGSSATGGAGAGGSSGVTEGGSGTAGSDAATGGSAGTMGAGGTTGGGGTMGGGGTAPACNSDAGLGPVVINELDAETPDFVEIFNTGSAACDLAGFKVTDAVGVNTAPKLAEALVFPPNTVIAAGGFVVVPAVNQPSQPVGPITCFGTVFPCYPAIYGISSTDGERVFLLAPGDVTIDTADWPGPLNDGGTVPVGQTVGRLPDGTGAFVYTRRTPGLTNQAP